MDNENCRKPQTQIADTSLIAVGQIAEIKGRYRRNEAPRAIARAMGIRLADVHAALNHPAYAAIHAKDSGLLEQPSVSFPDPDIATVKHHFAGLNAALERLGLL